MPESRGRGLALQRGRSSAGKLGDDVRGRLPPDGRRLRERHRSRPDAGEALPEGTLPGRHRRAAPATRPGTAASCYVDLLYPGVTEKFLEVTLERLPPRDRRPVRQARARRRSPTSRNIRPAGGLPWTDDLPAAVPEALGLRPARQPAQPAPAGGRLEAGAAQLLPDRCSSCSSSAGPSPTTSTARSTAWSSPATTGSTSGRNCIGVPDNMAMYAWQQRPAIDCLMNQYGEDTHAQFGNVAHGQGAVQRRQPARPQADALRGLRGRRLGPALRGHEADRRLALRAGRQHARRAPLLHHHPRRAQARPSAVVLLSRAVVGGLPRDGRVLHAALGGHVRRASRSTASSCSSRRPRPGCTRATRRRPSSSSEIGDELPEAGHGPGAGAGRIRHRLRGHHRPARLGRTATELRGRPADVRHRRPAAAARRTSTPRRWSCWRRIAKAGGKVLCCGDAADAGRRPAVGPRPGSWPKLAGWKQVEPARSCRRCCRD